MCLLNHKFLICGLTFSMPKTDIYDTDHRAKQTYMHLNKIQLQFRCFGDVASELLRLLWCLDLNLRGRFSSVKLEQFFIRNPREYTLHFLRNLLNIKF